MGKYFNQADVFPVIADSIRKIYQRKRISLLTMKSSKAY